jgi:hypothetical protein
VSTAGIVIVVSIVISQGIIALVLLRIMKTFGVYAESLLYTHQQNLAIRQNLATQESDIAAREVLRRSKLDEEIAS